MRQLKEYGVKLILFDPDHPEMETVCTMPKVRREDLVSGSPEFSNTVSLSLQMFEEGYSDISTEKRLSKKKRGGQ